MNSNIRNFLFNEGVGPYGGSHVCLFQLCKTKFQRRISRKEKDSEEIVPSKYILAKKYMLIKCASENPD
jgi:hypothetical protein